jgi:Ankyrin repeats (many copies)
MQVQVGHYIQITSIGGSFFQQIYSITSISKTSDEIRIDISNIQDSSDVHAIIINSAGQYMLKGVTGPMSLFFQSDLSKFQRSTRNIQPGPSQFAVTGVEEIDMNILTQMDDKTLTSACQIDRYISSLCSKEQLWKRRVEKYYSGAEEYKKMERTWREYYGLLSTLNPNEHGLSDAIMYGHLDILRWMASLDPPILPDKDDLYMAAEGGYLDIFRWAASLDPPILPYGNMADIAADQGHLDILRWMYELDTPVRMVYNDLDKVAENGHLNVLQWLNSLDPPIPMEPYVANIAAEYGHSNILQWLKKLDPPIVPDI